MFRLHPDRGFAEARAASERSRQAARRHAGSEAFARAGQRPARRRSELPDLIAAVRDCPNLRLLGLMTMPPWSDDAEQSRPYFRRLRELAVQHRLAASFDGHVARSGSRHRRGRHARAHGNGAVRQAQEAVNVAYYAPLPPARTGVADYAAALLAALRRHGSVEPHARQARRRALSSGQQSTAPRDLPARAGASPA